jgi:hypothetical protein
MAADQSDEDKILGKVGEWKGKEHDAASKMGEVRADIKSVLEEHSLHPKAMSMIRVLDKMSDEKRADVLDSFDKLREMFDPKWGNQQKMDLD